MAENDNSQSKPKIHYIKATNNDASVKHVKHTTISEIQAEEEERKQNILTIVIFGIGVIGILLGCFLIYRAHNYKQYTIDQIAQDKTTYKKLSNKYTKLRHAKIIDPESGQETLMSAIKQGDQLAKLQNKYTTMKLTSKNMHQMKSDLLKLYGKTQEYDMPDTTVWYDPGKKSDPGHWKFESRFTFSDGDKIKVLFTNTSKSGKLLAYTTAYYLVKKKQFTDVKTVVTSAGNGNSSSSDKLSKKAQKKQMQKEIKKIQKATKGQKVHKISRKDAEALEKHREKEVEKAKKEGKYSYAD